MSGLTLVSHLALWGLVIFQGLVLLGLVRVVHQLRESSVGVDSLVRGAGTGNGRMAPSFTAADIFGRAIDSADFRGRMTALLFVSPDCSSCMVTLDELNALRAKAKDNVIVICRAGREQCMSLAKTHDVRVPMIADESLAISELFDVSAVPIAVLINENNRIGSYGHPARGEDLNELLLGTEAGAEAVR